MKKITHLFSVLSLIFVSLLLTSCDPDGILTDEQTGEDIPLVIIDPNFTTTSFQLRLLDIETGNRIEEPVDVELFSNKPLVDLSGKFISSETVTNGLLDFSLSPNEEVSQSDTLKIYIRATTEDGTYKFTPKIEQTIDEKYGVISLTGEQVSDINAEQPNSRTTSHLQISDEYISNTGMSVSDFFIGIDGVPWDDFIKNVWGTRKDIFRDPFLSRFTSFQSETKAIDEYFNAMPGTGFSYYNPDKLQKDTEFSVDYANLAIANKYRYTFDIFYKNADGFPVRQEIFDNGGTNIFVFREDDYLQRAINYFPERYSGRIPNYNGKFTLEKGSQLMGIRVAQFFDQPSLEDCKEGFNFQFQGLENQETPVEFEYKVTRDNKYTAALGITSLTNSYPVHNTGNHYYSTSSNKVEFKENSQYYIEPSTLELGGVGACDSTKTFNVLPKEDVERYTINVQTQCAGQNASLRPTASVFFREQGQTNWEGTRFAGGKSTLYLKPETLYGIEGQYRDSDFSFTMSTGQQQFDEAITETIKENPEIDNIMFSGTTRDGNKHLDIKIIYTSESCPI